MKKRQFTRLTVSTYWSSDQSTTYRYSVSTRGHYNHQICTFNFFVLLYIKIKRKKLTFYFYRQNKRVSGDQVVQCDPLAHRANFDLSDPNIWLWKNPTKTLKFCLLVFFLRIVFHSWKVFQTISRKKTILRKETIRQK